MLAEPVFEVRVQPRYRKVWVAPPTVPVAPSTFSLVRSFLLGGMPPKPTLTVVKASLVPLAKASSVLLPDGRSLMAGGKGVGVVSSVPSWPLNGEPVSVEPLSAKVAAGSSPSSISAAASRPEMRRSRKDVFSCVWALGRKSRRGRAVAHPPETKPAHYTRRRLRHKASHSVNCVNRSTCVLDAPALVLEVLPDQRLGGHLGADVGRVHLPSAVRPDVVAGDDVDYLQRLGWRHADRDDAQDLVV